MSIIHQIGLSFIDTVGPVSSKILLEHFGTAEAVFGAGKNDLLAIEGIGAVMTAQILSGKALLAAEQQLKFIEKNKIRPLFFTDPEYPARLKECHDAPVLLYYKGTASLNHERMLSVAGTRMATAYGKNLCAELAEALRPYNVVVVSGLAYGIDVAAHRESLKHQIPTVGVLGHGLDRIYPHLHKETAYNMLKNGGLLTEFPIHTKPEKGNFPRRNRIIAGISDATLVVEATLKGGALITAELANSYHKDVYTFPGRVNDLCSQGCNYLVKTNRAALISSADDLLVNLGWESLGKKKIFHQASLFPDLSAEERKIIEILKTGAALIDDIGLKTALPQNRLSVLMFNLEMLGIVTVLPGKRYQLN
nr:DNA-processing protein DprA [Pedobacter sp. ASV19]